MDFTLHKHGLFTRTLSLTTDLPVNLTKHVENDQDYQANISSNIYVSIIYYSYVLLRVLNMRCITSNKEFYFIVNQHSSVERI